MGSTEQCRSWQLDKSSAAAHERTQGLMPQNPQGGEGDMPEGIQEGIQDGVQGGVQKGALYAG